MTKDGGPAFPSTHSADGMSLRDWFAGQALADLASVDRDVEMFGVDEVAKECYQLADAMLAHRGEAD